MHNGFEQLTAYINIYMYIQIYTHKQAYPTIKALFYRQEASGCSAKRRTKTGGQKHCKGVGESIWEHLLVTNANAVSEHQQW